MKKLIAKFVFFIFGWKTTYKQAYKVPKCVMLAAPHTSNWDLVFSLGVYWLEDINAKFLIKDSYTNSFFGFFFKWLGAIGVDRKKNNNLVDYSVDLFNNSKELVLMVPAEGTRERVEKWKTGFYHIAKNANVPVGFGFLDYGKKFAGVGDVYTLCGVFETDMKYIEDFYATIEGRHPEKYNKKIF
jgi:1-acyl-sn-glycerol-3-phosphate acyltransferase